MVNYNELDPGIVDVVRFLNKHGFTTTDSGDGVTKFNSSCEPLMQCAIPFPHVISTTTPATLIDEATRMQALFDGAVGVFDDWTVEANFKPSEPDTAILFAAKYE